MSNPGSQDQNEKADLDEPKDGATNVGEGDYPVGYRRPPKEYQWKPGQSGNPKGRPRKKRDKQIILEKIMNETITISEDGEKRKVSKCDALFRSHMAKAIRGDTRSAKLILQEAERVGVGDPGAERAMIPYRDSVLQSDLLFENIDPDLLPDEDKVELARLATVMDLGGGITALSTRDFERAKEIANKGKGKDITLRG
jgi:hypothetical protein